MTRAMQLFHAVNSDGVGARTPDLRTHRRQACGQIGNLRFARGVFDDRCAFGQSRSHHQIFCAGDSDRITCDVCAFEMILHMSIDVTVMHFYCST